MKLTDLEASYHLLTVEDLELLVAKIVTQKKKYGSIKMNSLFRQRMMHTIRKCEESLREELTRRQEK